MDNKQFWKTVMSLLSDKESSSEKIMLLHKKFQILNFEYLFLKDIEKTTVILQSENIILLANKLSHLIFKVIFRYSKNLKIFNLNNVRDERTFQFSGISVDDDDDDKIKCSYFFDYIWKFFHFYANEDKYPNIFKQADITITFKKRLQRSQGELSSFENFTCHC